MMSVRSSRSAGAIGFGVDYWQEVYGTPGHVDGYGNAAHHAAYLKALFDLDMAPVCSVADLGFGLGRMLQSVCLAFHPERVLGIEPSVHAFDQLTAEELHTQSDQVCLLNTDLLSWCRRENDAFTFFDLGICSSVWQYLSDAELVEVVPVLARRFRWLYLTVPTEQEYDLMAAQTGFVDRFAQMRSAAHYRQLVRPYFDLVSSRVLESRRYGAPGPSPFTEALFRF